MKLVIFLVVSIYLCFRSVYGAKLKTSNSLTVEAVDYGEYGNYLPPDTVKKIPCKYTNKNQKVEWIDPSGNVVSDLTTNRIFAQKHISQTLRGDKIPSLLLTITDTSVEDSGEYECRSGDLSEKISICVIDPLTFVDTPSEVSVDEGRSYTLTCEARGRPEPSLVWYRNEEIISDDCNSTKYKVMTKFNSQGFQGQLTITSIDPDDAGLYTCEAIQEHRSLDNCTFSKVWNITLNVNHAPTFADGNITVLFAKYNESVDLECDPRAYPTPTFRWFSELNKETLLNFPSEQVVPLEDDTKTKVTVVATALTFGVSYVCRATNSLGSAAKTFVVMQLEKPKKPNEVDAYNSTASQIYLNVTWLDEVLFPVEEIDVQCIKDSGRRRFPKESEWRKTEFKTYEIDGLEEEEVKVSINELEPDTDYCIRVRASNELGSSPWSTPIFAYTAEEDEPTESEDADESEPVTNAEGDEVHTDTLFYGLFFLGAVMVVGYLCVLVLKKV